MKITQWQLRQIIREELLREAGETDLNNYSISLSGTNAIKVVHKPTGATGVSSKIQVEVYGKIIDVVQISNIRFYPNAPQDSPVFLATVELDNAGPNIKKDAELKNRAALLGIANAIIKGTYFKAPPGPIPGGGTASLIINGKD